MSVAEFMDSISDVDEAKGVDNMSSCTGRVECPELDVYETSRYMEATVECGIVVTKGEVMYYMSTYMRADDELPTFAETKKFTKFLATIDELVGDNTLGFYAKNRCLFAKTINERGTATGGNIAGYAVCAVEYLMDGKEQEAISSFLLSMCSYFAYTIGIIETEFGLEDDSGSEHIDDESSSWSDDDSESGDGSRSEHIGDESGESGGSEGSGGEMSVDDDL